MLTEESTIVTQAVFNQDKTHRVLLKKKWNEGKTAAILMTNPATADIYSLDYTTMFCINSLSALGYGSVSIVNLFSYMTTKLDLKGDLQEITIKENTEQIIRTVEECDVFIVAIGRIADNYKKVADYQLSLFEKLRQHQDKVHTIANSQGVINLHPLSPTLRNKPWNIIPFTLPMPPVEKQEDEQQENKTTKPVKALKK